MAVFTNVGLKMMLDRTVPPGTRVENAIVCPVCLEGRPMTNLGKGIILVEECPKCKDLEYRTHFYFSDD